MYGKTVGEFGYKGKTFQWKLFPHAMMCYIYSGEEIVGRIRIQDMDWRNKKRAEEALYPVCDKWLERKQ